MSIDFQVLPGRRMRISRAELAAALGDHGHLVEHLVHAHTGEPVGDELLAAGTRYALDGLTVTATPWRRGTAERILRQLYRDEMDERRFLEVRRRWVPTGVSLELSTSSGRTPELLRVQHVLARALAEATAGWVRDGDGFSWTGAGVWTADEWRMFPRG